MVTGGSVFFKVVEIQRHTTGPMSRLSAAGTALKRGNVLSGWIAANTLQPSGLSPLRVAPAEDARCQRGNCQSCSASWVFVICHKCPTSGGLALWN